MDSNASAHLCYCRDYFSSFESVTDSSVLFVKNKVYQFCKEMMKIQKLLNGQYNKIMTFMCQSQKKKDCPKVL